MSFLGGGANLGSAYGAIIIGTDSALRNINILGGALRASAANAMGAGKDYFTAGLLLSTAGAAMQLSFRGIIDDGMSFDKQMSAVAATLGSEAIPMMDEMRQLALDLGEATQFTANEVGMAMEELAKAGVSALDIIEGVAAATAHLAAATGTDMTASANALAVASNVFGLTADEADHAADIITTALNKSSADIHDFTAGMRSLGPVAANMGIPFEEAASAIATFTTFGLRGADAGVSLARGITLAAKPTEEATALMEQYGITVFDAQGKFVGFGPLFDNLQQALGDVSDKEREAALSMIFGAEAADVMGFAVENGSAKYREILKATEEYNTAAEAASTRMDNLSGDVEKLTGSLQTARIEIFERVNPALRALTQLMDRMVGVFTGAPPAIKDVTAAVLGLGGALASFAGAQLLFGNRIKAGISALRAYEFAFFGLRFTILKLLGIIGLLGAAWSLNIFGVRDKIVGFADDVKGAFDKVVAAWEPVSKILDYIFSRGVNEGQAAPGSSITSGLGLDVFLDELTKSGIAIGHAQDLIKFFKDMHRPLRITERLFRNARKGVGDFFNIISGGDRSMHDFRRRMTQVFGKQAADQIAESTFQMRRGIRRLRGEVEKQFGIDLGSWFSLEGVLGLVSGSFNFLVDVIQDRVLPWLGPKLAKGLDLVTQGLFFAADHLGTAKTLFSEVGTIVGNVLTGAFRVFGQLLDGDVRGAIDTVLAGIGELTGLVTSIPLGDIAISIGSWSIEAGITLASAVAKKVGEWWDELKTPGKDLEGYKIRLFGWDVTQGHVLLIAVRDKVLEWWENTRDDRQRLYGYGIQLFDWSVDQGSVLLIAVRDKVNALWGLVSTAPQRLYGYAIDLYGWAINEGQRLVDVVRPKVAAFWLATLGTRQKLFGYAIDLYGWAIGEGETLLDAVRPKVTALWLAILGAPQQLYGYAIDLYGWVIDQGELLVDAVGPKVAGWWATIIAAGKDLPGYKVKLTDWAVDTIDDGGKVAQAVLDWAKLQTFSVAGYLVSVGAPSADGVTIDGGALWAAVNAKINSVWFFDEARVAQEKEQSREIGRKIGENLVRWVIEGISLFFGSGAAGGGAQAEGEALPELLFSMLVELVRGILEGAFAQFGKWLTDITPNQVETWIAQPDPIGRLVGKWFDTLFGKPIVGVAKWANQWMTTISDAFEDILGGSSDPTVIGSGVLVPGKDNPIETRLGELITGMFDDIDLSTITNPFSGLGSTIYGWISDQVGSLEDLMNGLPEWAKLLLAGDVVGAAQSLFGGGKAEAPKDLPKGNQNAAFFPFGMGGDRPMVPPKRLAGEGDVVEAERRVEVTGVPEVVNEDEILRLIDEDIRRILGGPQVGQGFTKGAFELGLPVKVNPDATGEGPTTSFDADISGVQNALGRAVQLGNFWASQTFSASFSAGVSGDVGAIGSGIGAVLGGIGAGIDALTAKGPMLGGLANPMNNISTAAIGMGAAFGANMPKINAQIDKTAGQLRVTFPGAMSETAAAAARVHTQMGAAFSNIRNDAINTSRSGATGFRENYSNNLAAAQSRAAGVTASMRANFSSFAGSTRGYGSGAGFNFRDGLGGGLSSAQGTASGHIGSIKGILSSVSDGAYGAGNYAGLQVGQGLENGLYAKIPGVSAAARALAAAAVVPLGSGLEVLSPSRITTWMGEMTGQGLIDGMMSKVHGVQVAASLLSDAALPIVDSAALAGLSLPNEIPGMTQIVNVSNQIGSIDVSQAEDLVRWGKFVGGINQGHATTMAGSS